MANNGRRCACVAKESEDPASRSSFLPKTIPVHGAHLKQWLVPPLLLWSSTAKWGEKEEERGGEGRTKKERVRGK